MVIGAVVIIFGGAIAVTGLVWASAAKRPAPERGLPPATAQVTRTTLVESRTISGTLGYGDPTPIRPTGTGTLTWIASVGSAVKRGEPLYRVDERPVIALYGPVPIYRTLRVGAAGADVRQLQENLAELGYTGFAVDGTYGYTTAAAVRKWETDIGLPATGTIEAGEAVFTPGVVRIAEQTASVGDLTGERGVSVLSYTGTTKLVTVLLDVADQPLAVEGRKVTVTVPGRNAVEGEISRVGTVIKAKETSGSGGATAPKVSTSPAPTGQIVVTVTIADQEALGRLDAAPADVAFVSEERKDVLTVPVAALLALTQGGYGVEIVDGRRTRIVAVKTGMFAAGRVEVSGEGIADGMTVGVPK
jgi:multidrug efflux system membrane fusion protein